jgi:asparagine synthetase B (glutamine-hydrolysing)
LGQLPFYYGSRPGVFAFAPEVKGVLVHDGFEAHLSTPGIINFLSAGYCFGDLTLFENVNALEPSTLLSVDLGTLAFKKTRLWKMIYEPAPELRLRRVAEDELFESILEAHKTTLCDGPARVALLLSASCRS